MSDQNLDITHAELEQATIASMGRIMADRAEQLATLTARCEALEVEIAAQQSAAEAWKALADRFRIENGELRGYLGEIDHTRRELTKAVQGNALAVVKANQGSADQITELQLRCEALTAERDSWRRVAERLEGEKVEAQTRCQRLEQAVKDLKPLADRATEYLCVGGFFNPELMEHRKVSELVLDLRNALAALASLLPTQEEPQTDENRVSFAAGYSAALDDALKGK